MKPSHSHTFRFSILSVTLLCLILLGCSASESPAALQLSNFSASPQLISAGGQSVLSWQDATPGATLHLEPGIELTGKTSYTVSPDVTTSYTLKISKNGLTKSYVMTVNVRSTGSPETPATTEPPADTTPTAPGTPPTAPQPGTKGFSSSKTLLAVNEQIAFGWNLSGMSESLTCTLEPGDGTSYDLPDCGAKTSQIHSYKAPGAYVASLRAVSPDGSETFKVFPTVATYDPNAFNIDVVFLDDTMSASQRAIFESAAARWAQVIVADVRDFGSDTYTCRDQGSFTGAIDDLVIMASAPDIDGRFGVLGQAGPCVVNRQTGKAIYGIMNFDRADLDHLETKGGLESTILHEMGHVLGIGTLWVYNDLINEAAYAYTGEHALTEYRKLEGASQAHVPTEDEGGRGTVNGHWNKEDFGNELMTGTLDTFSSPMSKVTIGSLEDLGYAVNYDAADRYPSAGLSLTPLSTYGEPHLHSDPVEPLELLEY